jgi:prepilin-type N-terminal cleavage/methylation domain-containing protein
MKRNRNSQRGFTLMEMLVVAFILAVGLCIVLGAIGVTGAALFSNMNGRMDPSDFNRIMATENIQNAQSTGYQYTGCGDGDTIHEGFTGVKNGVPVTGVVMRRKPSVGRQRLRSPYLLGHEPTA